MRYSVKVTRRQQEQIPLLLRSLGIDHVQEPIRRPGGFPVWQIFYGVSGTGVFYADGLRAVLHPGQIAVLPPDSPHGYQSLGGEWQLHYVGFEGTLCSHLMATLRLSQSGVYSVADPAPLFKRLERLAGLAAEEKPRQAACSQELYGLLLELSAGVRRLPQSRAEESEGMAKEMILYLEDHFSEDISLQELSERFHLTPEYLCACFKAETQETIMQYLRRIRIHHAKLLLMEAPDMSLSKIAAACGFHSTSYFGKVFRQSSGMTPQAYRLGAVWRPPAVERPDPQKP